MASRHWSIAPRGKLILSPRGRMTTDLRTRAGTVTETETNDKGDRLRAVRCARRRSDPALWMALRKVAAGNLEHDSLNGQEQIMPLASIEKVAFQASAPGRLNENSRLAHWALR
jgi:hypothetical protein